LRRLLSTGPETIQGRHSVDCPHVRLLSLPALPRCVGPDRDYLANGVSGGPVSTFRRPGIGRRRLGLLLPRGHIVQCRCHHGTFLAGRYAPRVRPETPLDPQSPAVFRLRRWCLGGVPPCRPRGAYARRRAG
jgi:hypothetical protein